MDFKDLFKNRAINIVLFAFISVAIIITFSRVLTYNQLNSIYNNVNNIYNHPLRVSNAALTVQLEVYKMHRSMKDVVLSNSIGETNFYSNQVDEYEQAVYRNLKIIETNILGEKGQQLQQKTYELFKAWKIIRDEVISLKKSKQDNEAILITKRKGALHVVKLDKATKELYDYASKKAAEFKQDSNLVFDRFEVSNLFLTIFMLIFLVLIVAYVLYVIKGYLSSLFDTRSKLEHTNKLLGTIRSINQLLAREKSIDEVLKGSCKLLSALDIYKKAYILQLNEISGIKKVHGMSKEEEASQLEFLYHLLEELSLDDKKDFNLLERSKCPLLLCDEDTFLFTTVLKASGKLYGLLMIPIQKRFFKDEQELVLLKEIANDIAASIYNLHVQTQYKESERRFETLLSNLTGMAYQSENDQNHTMSFVSTGSFLLTGYDSKELINSKPCAYGDLIVAEDKAMVKQAIDQANIKNPNFEARYRIKTKASTIKWVWEKGKKIYGANGFLYLEGFISDVTDEQRLKEEISFRNKELEFIIEETPVPMILHNEKGEIVSINRAWEKLSGFSHQEIPTINDWIIKTKQNDSPEVREHISSLYSRTDNIDEGEFELDTPNGLLTWHFYSAPLGKVNGLRSVISTAVDITELKEKEQVLIQQSKMASMGEMLENIAHQWRQPLSVISTVASALEMEKKFGILKDEKLSNSLTKIIDTTKYLSSTIDDFRDFFSYKKQKKDFTLDEVWQKCMMLLQSKFKSRNIELISDIQSLKVNGNSSELVQVFVNILNNACDILEDSSNKRYIRVQITSQEDHAHITIHDSGGGVSKEIITKVFDPYFTTKHQSQGTGIGLYMSSSIIKKHFNGSIEVQNRELMIEQEELFGACFIIKIPLALKEAQS